MRRYAIGLQLVVLICCAVASGYLWRAALETGRAIRYVSAGKPYEPPWPALGSGGRVAVTHVPTRKPPTHVAGPKAAPPPSRHAAPSASVPSAGPGSTRRLTRSSFPHSAVRRSTGSSAPTSRSPIAEGLSQNWRKRDGGGAGARQRPQRTEG